MRNDVLFENGYEAEAWRQIQEWEQRPDARLQRAVQLAGRPVGRLADRLVVRPVLDRAGGRIGDGMRAAATSVASRVDVEAVLRRTSAEAGRTLATLEDLRTVDLRTLDRLAAGTSRRYVAAASVSGGAAGATASLPGGSFVALGALGADVVATTTMLLKAIAEYGTQFGRDVRLEQEAQFAVGLLSLGAVAGDEKQRRELLTEIHAVSAFLAGGASWAELSRHSSTRALQAVFDKLGVRLTRRKLAQVVPFFGAAAGGTLGAVLADRTCTGALMQYRRRYLVEKYPALR